MSTKATRKERIFIERLKKLMGKCPDTLWFFSTGHLHILKKGKDGELVYRRGDGIDQEMIVDTIVGPVFEGGDF